MMKKVMKFVKGNKKEEEVKNTPVDSKKIVPIEKIEEVPKEDDILRDKSVTKLHKAVWNENSDKLKSIIKTHDIDITDKLDRTALYFAVLKNNPYIVDLLLESNANHNIPDIDGITPFLKSIQLGFKQCAAILLNHGADIKKTDKDLNSCLHYAVMEKHVDLLPFLFKYNADPNVSNSAGEYPLHIAVRMQNMQMIQSLLENNADIRAPNASGQTPLTFAIQYGDTNIIACLEEYNTIDFPLKHKSPVKKQPEQNKSPVKKPPEYKSPVKKSIEHKSPVKKLSEPLKSPPPRTILDRSDSDDSTLSTPTKRERPGPRLPRQFFDDTDISEKSESDMSIKCSENTSPQSGIIPPPCKPLRSLEYLQAGLNMETRPVHLLTLGTVRTRHISMTESDHSKNTTPHRYSYQGDLQNTNERTDDSSHKLAAKLECDSIQSDWGSNESLPLDEIGKRDKLDGFLEKQFSILEDYETKKEKEGKEKRNIENEYSILEEEVKCSCEEVLEKYLESYNIPQGQDINHLLEDNNRINAQLEKYAGQSTTHLYSKKSKSLPRNSEPYGSDSYHKGSYSLPRTLEDDQYREMRRYGYFKPRSHFFSLKLYRGEKRAGFMEKLKSMFNAKKIHLTDSKQENTWLNNTEFYSKPGHSTQFYHDTTDDFHTEEDLKIYEEIYLKKSGSFSEQSNFSVSVVLPTTEIKEIEENVSVNSAFNNEHGRTTTDKQNFLPINMNESGHSRNASTSKLSYTQKCTPENCPKTGAVKYDAELKQLRAEKSQNTCNANTEALKYQEEAERWKKQYEDLITKISAIDQRSSPLDEDNWRKIVQNEVSSAVNILKENSEAVVGTLEKHNAKLEVLVEKLQRDLDQSAYRQQELELELKSTRKELTHYTRSSDDGLKKENKRLLYELENITCMYNELQHNYEENIKKIEKDIENSSYITKDFEVINAGYKKLTRSMQELTVGIGNLRNSVLIKTEEIREKLNNIDEPLIDEEYLRKITESLESLEVKLIPIEPPNPDNIKRHFELIKSCRNAMCDIQELNTINSDLEVKIKEMELDKDLNLAVDENYILKEKIINDSKVIETLTIEVNDLKQQVSTTDSKIEENEVLQKKSKESFDQVQLFTKQLQDKKALIQKLEVRISELTAIVNQLETDKEELTQELDELKPELESEQFNNTTLTEENNELREKLNQYLEINNKYTEENTGMNESLDDLTKENDILNEKLDSTIQLNEHLNATLLELKEKNDQLEKMNNDLKTNILQLTQRLNNSSKPNYTKLLAEIDQLKTEKVEIIQKHEKDKSNLDSLTQRMDTLQFYHENEMATNSARYNELLAENEELKKALKADLKILKSDNDSLQYAVNSIKIENKFGSGQELDQAMDVLKHIIENKLGDPCTEVSPAEIETVQRVKQLDMEDGDCKEVKLEISGMKQFNYLPDKSDACQDCCDEQKTNLILERLSNIETQVHHILRQNSQQFDTKSTSLPNLDDDPLQSANVQYIYCESDAQPIRKSSSLEIIPDKSISPHISQFSEKWAEHLQIITNLRQELMDVTEKLNLTQQQRNQSPNDMNQQENYKEIINMLQQQVNELTEKAAEERNKTYNLEAELQDLRGDMMVKTDMEEEMEKLRRELSRQKFQKVQEIETIKLKKEAEMMEATHRLKEEYLNNKHKILTDLASVQKALQDKTNEEQILRTKCSSIANDVEQIKKASQPNYSREHSYIPVPQAVHPVPIIQRIDECRCTKTQPSTSKKKVTIKSKCCDTSLASAREKLNKTIEKHRINSDPSPESVQDEELKKKYLLEN